MPRSSSHRAVPLPISSVAIAMGMTVFLLNAPRSLVAQPLHLLKYAFPGLVETRAMDRSGRLQVEWDSVHAVEATEFTRALSPIRNLIGASRKIENNILPGALS